MQVTTQSRCGEEQSWWYLVALFWLAQSRWRAGDRRGAFWALGFVIAFIVLVFFLTGGDVEKTTTRVGIGFLVGGFMGCIKCLWTATKRLVKRE